VRVLRAEKTGDAVPEVPEHRPPDLPDEEIQKRKHTNPGQDNRFQVSFNRYSFGEG
jgi:hypothetical protein